MKMTRNAFSKYSSFTKDRPMEDSTESTVAKIRERDPSWSTMTIELTVHCESFTIISYLVQHAIKKEDESYTV